MRKLLLSAIAAFGMLAAQAQIPTSGLVIRYPMAGNVADSSGNGYDATATSLTYVNGINGSANGAASFDGTTSRIIYDFGTNTSPFQLQTYTASAWVNLAALPNQYANIFEIGDASYFRFVRGGTNQVRLQVGHKVPGSFSGGDLITQAVTKYQNKWSHLLVTSQVVGSNRVYKVYLNNDSIGVFTSALPNINYAATDNKLQIGNRIGVTTLSLSGAMQDFCYYNRVLSPAEIKQLYNARACPSPVAFTSPTEDSIINQCAGTPLNLAVSTSGGTNVTYEWTKSDTILTSVTTSAINVTSSAPANSGIYKVRALADNCPLGRTLPYSFTVKIGTPPPILSQFSGNLTPCVESTNSYTILGITNPQDYTWTWNVPNGSWGASFTNNFANVLVGDTATANFYAEYSNGCGSPRRVSFSSVRPTILPPAKLDSISAPGPFCIGRTIGFYASPNVAGVTYNWTVPTDWTNSTNVTGGYASTLQSTGIVTVVANTGCGVSDTLKKTFTVSPYPQEPTATQVGNTLQTTAVADAYIWYAYDSELADTVILGASGQTYSPAADSVYYLGVDINGCVTQSEAIYFTATPNDISTVKEGFLVKMYPNPAANIVVIETAATKPAIAVIDMLGKIVFTQNNSNAQTQIATNNWPNGVYMVTIESGNQKATQRLVINR